MNSNRYIISGGGTGGHIFPALAIANELRRRMPNCEILFVGANGKMEMEKIPQAGFEIKGLDIAGFQRGSISKNIFLPFKILKSLYRASQIVKQFKPDVAIGVGGYASGPLLFAAALKGLPTVIQEQNAVPGLTNKILSKNANVICAAYAELKEIYKGKNVVVTGNPIRANIISEEITKQKALEFFQLDPSKKTILLIGGSLGAKTFNECVKNNISLFRNSSVQLIWQTGKGYFEQYKAVAANFSTVVCVQFLDRMDMAYAAADIIISRGGAMTISELECVGKPVVFVPSPNVTDDQQTHNVMALVKENAAILVKDNEANEKLFPVAFELLADDAKRKMLAANIKARAKTNASEKIVDEIVKL